MQYYSQYGEDRLLWEYCGGRTPGLCVEVGGYDGVTGSNSLFFEEQGWRTIIVEPMPDFAEMIRVRRPRAHLFNFAAGAAAGEVSFTIPTGAEAFATMSDDQAQMDRIKRVETVVRQITVPVRTLDDMLEGAGVEQIDFITIDVEGAEELALDGFNLARWKPRIIIVENNDGRFSARFHRRMGRSGYYFLRRTGCNEWYVRHSEPAVTRALRLSHWLCWAFLTIGAWTKSPFKRLWRESGLKAWNHRRIRARRARKQESIQGAAMGSAE